MKIALAVAVGLIAGLSGCASMVVLKNEKGEAVTCDNSTSAMLGGMIAGNAYMSKCINQYEKAGYKRVDGR